MHYPAFLRHRGLQAPVALLRPRRYGQVDERKLEKVLSEVMDLSPRGIREHLGLNKPIYARTAAYGHFGRQPDLDGGFSWERLDLTDDLKAAFS